MYYPIIDKLKEIMTDITSVKDKEPLVIEGTMTSTTGGTWSGEWTDIDSAFSNDRPIYFKVPGAFVPIVVISNAAALSGPFYTGANLVIGQMNDNGTFVLNPVQ